MRRTGRRKGPDLSVEITFRAVIMVVVVVVAT